MRGRLTKDITYVIPTRNRPQFLRRLLTFWSRFPPRGTLLIADCSESWQHQKNRQVVESFSGRLPIECESIVQSMIAKCDTAIRKVRTPYAVFCADDDFLLPDAVMECLEFLQKNSDYACAQGLLVSVNSFRDNRIDLIRGYNLAAESEMDRFRQMAKYWYSTFYAVYPTEVLQENFRIATLCADYHDARIFSEMMLTQMTTLQGKIKFFPKFFNVRQEHELNDSRALPRVQDIACGEQHYLAFRELLVGQITQHTDMRTDQAAAVVDRYYQSLKHGQMVGNGMAKVHREIARGARKFLGKFRTNSVLERRRLPADHRLLDNSAWKLSQRLIQEYPEGMSEEECRLETERSDDRMACAA